MSTHESFEEAEWTSEELKALALLPRERIPSRVLKDRTIEAVRHVGIGNKKRLTPLVAAALATAAALIFIAGAAAGYAVARRTPPPSVESRAENGQAVAKTDDKRENIQPMRVVWY